MKSSHTLNFRILFVTGLFYVAMIVGCSASSKPITLTIDANKIKAKKGNFYRFEHKQFNIRFAARSPEQVAAFYYGRKFPKRMVDEIRKACFITTGVKNKTNQILWHDMSKWEFVQDNKPVKRILRPDWFGVWKKLNVPLRFQSTFRWTLIPETLDFRPDESEGGNITLPRQSDKPIRITAKFVIGDKNTGQQYIVIINNVNCAKDPK